MQWFVQLCKASSSATLRRSSEVCLRPFRDSEDNTASRGRNHQSAMAHFWHFRPSSDAQVLAVQALAMERNHGETGSVRTSLEVRIETYRHDALTFFLYRWYDGFSTFYVNSQGLVTLHVADKVC